VVTIEDRRGGVTPAKAPELVGVAALKTVETSAFMFLPKFITRGGIITRFGPVAQTRGFLPAEQ
jgi:hypothetical protein